MPIDIDRISVNRNVLTIARLSQNFSCKVSSSAVHLLAVIDFSVNCCKDRNALRKRISEIIFLKIQGDLRKSLCKNTDDICPFRGREINYNRTREFSGKVNGSVKGKPEK